MTTPVSMLCSSRNTRSRDGCLTCRCRSKGCDGSTNYGGGCKNCSDLRIECVKPQDWYKIKEQREAFTKAVLGWTSVRKNKHSSAVMSLSHFPITISTPVAQPSVHDLHALNASDTGLDVAGPSSQNAGVLPVAAIEPPISAPVFNGQDFAVDSPMFNASNDDDLASNLENTILAGGGVDWASILEYN